MKSAQQTATIREFFPTYLPPKDDVGCDYGQTKLFFDQDQGLERAEGSLSTRCSPVKHVGTGYMTRTWIDMAQGKRASILGTHAFAWCPLLQQLMTSALAF